MFEGTIGAQVVIENSNINVGDTARLHCRVVNANGDVTVTWFHNDEPLSVLLEGHYAKSGVDLVIANVVRNDTGSYSCSVSTENDKITSSAAEMNVHCKSIGRR